MRFLTGIAVSIVVSLVVGFFPSIVEAEQNSCDPDSEYYDARTCFDYVRALEAKNASAKRDLAASRRETSVVTSQLAAAKAQHAQSSYDSRLDAVLRALKIRALETTVNILSKEKETAWGYVDFLSKILAAAIGLAILGGIIGFYFLRKSVSDYDRYAVEVRDARISELEDKLHRETDAKLIACDDAAILRQELFHTKSNLAMARRRYTNILNYLRKEMSRFEAIRKALYQTIFLLQANGSRLEKLSELAQPHTTV